MSRVMPALLTSTCSPPSALTMPSIACADRIAVGDVEDDAAAAGIGGERFADRRRAGFGRRRADDAKALGRQGERDRPADAARCAGDERDLARCRGRLAHCSKAAAAASEVGSATAAATASGSIRVTMPASTLPGPHSKMWPTPRARIAWIVSDQRTAPNDWR